MGVGSERAVGMRMRKLEHRLLRQATLTDPDTPRRGRVVILGELNLDLPRSLQALKKVLNLYASEPEGTTPLAFVLTGNFTSHAIMARGGSGGSIEYKEYFDALASTLADYPALLTTSTFIFVPGDNDGWVSAFSGGAAVPLLAEARTGHVYVEDSEGLCGGKYRRQACQTARARGGEAIWTTNPSRLTLFGPNHELVLFRDDILSRFRRTSVRLKTASKDPEEEADGGGDLPVGDGQGHDDVNMSDNPVTDKGASSGDAMDIDADSPTLAGNIPAKQDGESYLP